MYQPSQKMLEKYANVMVNFAVNHGKGVKKGDNVFLFTPIVAIPLAKEMYKILLKKGAIPFINIFDDEFSLINYELSSDEQLLYSPMALYKGMAATYDHSICILGDEDPMLLKNCDPKKIMLSNKASKPYSDMLEKKENAGKFSWTLCLYGTEGMAKEANLSLKEYWNQIANSCFLNEKDPVAKWKWTLKEQKRIQNSLTRMKIDKIHVKSETTDLWINMGEERKWNSGSGCNIPSFEIYTSPDWRGASGYVNFDLPLYRYGNIIEGIFLGFEDGRVVNSKAQKNEKLLKEMIAQDGMDKIGEFSLTDKRFSKISKFMAETLFDENFGGKYGNFHIALGDSYPDTYSGDISTMNKAKKKKLGYNDSVDHTDMISTQNRVVTVVLKNGKSKVIYKNGEFTI